jgi:hypothetical protein
MKARGAIGLLALSACMNGAPPAPQTGVPRITSFKADPLTVDAGQEVKLTWTTSNVSGVDIEPRVGLQDATGMAIDKPFATTTYVLSVPGHAELTSQVTVSVMGPPAITQFTAMPRTIAQGASAMLSWTTSNADHVTIDPDLGMQPASGSQMVTPMVSTTYRMVAVRGQQMSQPQQVTVVVASGNQPMVRSFTAMPQTVNAGDAVTLAWDVANADTVTIDNGVGQQPTTGSTVVHPTQTTIYSLSASGPGGTAVAPVTVNVAAMGPVSINRFDVMPATIAPGDMATLAWDTSNATMVSIDNGIGSVAFKGSMMVQPSQTTIYVLTAVGSDGSMQTQRAQLVVAQANDVVITSFVAQPAVVLQGASTTLSWVTHNATNVSIDNGVGAQAANGSVRVMPSRQTVYTLTAMGMNGSRTATVSVGVTVPPPAISAFTAMPASITQGAAATLSWTTSNATNVTIDNGVGAHPVNGTVQVHPTQTTVYTMTATGPGGVTSSMVSVTVTPVGAPMITSFTAAPQQIAPGAQSTLAWSVSNATSVTIDNGIGAQPMMGSHPVTPAVTTTYTLTAFGPGGTTTGQLTVNVVATVGDTCSSAFAVNGSGTFAGNTLQALNDYQDAQSCTGFQETGPDQVYRVALNAGDRLQATLQPTTSWDSAIYVVTSCANIAQSCVAGIDGTTPEHIDYTAVAAGTYYVIVDGFAGAGGPYTLNLNITPAPIPNDRCTGAIDVTHGGTFNGDTTNATNDYDPGSAGCTGFPETGHDVAYVVTLHPNDRIVASLDAPWDSALYLVSDCANVGTSCVAGSDAGNPEHIDYTSTGGGTYYLIVDGYANAQGTFTLTVSVSPGAVTTGDTCATAIAVPSGGGSFNGTTVGLNDDYHPLISCTGRLEPGADQVYSMTLGNGDVMAARSTFDPGFDGALYLVNSCTNITTCLVGADQFGAGQAESLRWVAQSAGTYDLIVDSSAPSSSGGHDLTVTTYTGVTCMLAAPLNTTGTEYVSTSGHPNSYSPNSGGCTGYTENGPDRAYSVTVNAGDQLQVTLHGNGGWDAALYVVSNCSDINGSCVAGSDVGTNTDETVAPVFPTSGVYYVIADGYNGTQGSGTLTAHIAHGDTCADAYSVPSTGGTFNGTTSNYAADYGTATSTGSCTQSTQLGRDAAYRVTLNAGQQLNATLTATWSSLLYLVTDCASSATTCLTGSGSGSPQQISYTNNGTSAQTYYLIVDAPLPSDTTTTREGPYTLTVSIN